MDLDDGFATGFECQNSETTDLTVIHCQRLDCRTQTFIKVGPSIGSVGDIHADQNLFSIALQINISIDPVLTSESLAGEKLLSKFGGFDIAVKEAVGFSCSTDAFGYFQ